MGASRDTWPLSPLPNVARLPHSDIGITWLSYHIGGLALGLLCSLSCHGGNLLKCLKTAEPRSL